MSNVEFSDADYIREIAKRYENSKCKDMRQHHARLVAVAARLESVPASPGMAVQALAVEIVEALLDDEEDGGFDLTAGMFGPAFSKLVRRWAAIEYAGAAAAGSVKPK